jgi:hypothetical protein
MSPYERDQHIKTGAENHMNRDLINWKTAVSVFLGVGGAVSVSLLVWQGAEWVRKNIDERVTAKLSDPQVLHQIALQVRPTLIFDARGTYISDMGVTQSVKSIEVTERNKYHQPKHIHIEFTRFLANAPLLSAMHDATAIFSDRGKEFSWEFEITWIVDETYVDDSLRVYRLELVP